MGDITFVTVGYFGGKLISYGGSWLRNSVSKWLTSRAEAAAAARLADMASRLRGLSVQERTIAHYLENRGRHVLKNLDEGAKGAGRQGDIFMDGLKTELKTLSPGGSQDALVERALEQLHRVRRGGGQATHVVIDARGTELTEWSANKVIARWFGKSEATETIEIIGDRFFVSPFEAAKDRIPSIYH
jgi:hypothetical protein